MDFGLFWALIALGLTGVVMIYSATRQALVNAGDNPHYYLERQGVFVFVGIIVMYFISRFEDVYKRQAPNRASGRISSPASPTSRTATDSPSP